MQIVLFDRDPGPDFGQQLILADEIARPPNQRCQKIERARA